MPATGVVIAASIFMASTVATVCPASTTSPTTTTGVTAPANGAATWPGWVGSAFSAVRASTSTARSRTWIGRSWPLRVNITVRIPRSSGVPIASRPTSSRTPFPSATATS